MFEPALLARLFENADTDLATLPPLEGDVLAPGTEEAILLSGDPAYLRRFAAPLVASVVRNGGRRIALQIHIVDADEAIEADVRFNLSSVFDGPMAVCRDMKQVGHGSPRNWYSCARYLRVPEILRRTRGRLLVLDLDMLTVAHLPAPPSPTSGAAWVHQDAGRDSPWNAVDARAVWFDPGPQGLLLASRVAAAAAYGLSLDTSPPCLAQLALIAAELDVPGGPGEVRVQALPYGLVAPLRLGLDDDATFLSVTAGSAYDLRLLATHPYLDYVPRIKQAFGWRLPGYDCFFETALAEAPRPHRGARRQWEHSFIDECLARVRNRRRAIDVGAHVGFWSAPLSRVFGQIEAFEPQWFLKDCFLANVASANVRLHNVGLAAESGMATCNATALNSGLTSVVPDGTGETILRALDEWRFADVDFVKIDVEGLELAVLQGARATLERCRPVVFIETGENCKRFGVEPGMALSYLRDLGAQVVKTFADENYLLTWSK